MASQGLLYDHRTLKKKKNQASIKDRLAQYLYVIQKQILWYYKITGGNKEKAPQCAVMSSVSGSPIVGKENWHV